jgi:hypothetical protein
LTTWKLRLRKIKSNLRKLSRTNRTRWELQMNLLKNILNFFETWISFKMGDSSKLFFKASPSRTG